MLRVSCLLRQQRQHERLKHQGGRVSMVTVWRLTLENPCGSVSRAASPMCVRCGSRNVGKYA